MKIWIHALVIIAGVAAVPATPTLGESRLTVRVNASVTSEPATVLVLTHVEPDDRNRTLTVVADSGAYMRSTQMSLDGAKDAETQQIWFKALPAGDYDITADLEGTQGLQARASTHVRVLPIH